MDNVSDIRDYYDASVCEMNDRLQRHQIEHDITLRYLGEYLPPKSRVLEIGAATGAYTLWLARRGHHVTAVDFSGKLIEECKRQVADKKLGRRVDCYVADARDLSPVPSQSFDAVLLMGPLYHLVLKADRKKALREAFNRLRPGGLLFSILISRYGIMGHLLRCISHWIENQGEVRSVIERGQDPEDRPKGGFRGYFASVEEIAPLHETSGFKTIVPAGVEPAISGDDEIYNRLEGKRRKLWLDLLYELSREASLVASSQHLLYIGQKPKKRGASRTNL